MTPRITDLGPGESKHQKILLRAAELFSHQGYEATRMEDIAATVGFTKAALYYYFPEGKEQILRELVRWGWDKLAQIPPDMITGDAPKDLEAVLRFHAQLYRRYSYVFDVLFREAKRIRELSMEDPEIDRLRRRYLQIYAGILKDHVHPEELPLLMRAIVGLVYAFLFLGSPTEQAMERLVGYAHRVVWGHPLLKHPE